MLGSVIDGFYEAAVQPSLWGRVLEQASIALGAEGVELYPGPESKFALLNTRSLDDAMMAGMSEGWFNDNPRVARGIPALKSAPVVTESMLFEREELDRLPFQAEFAGRFGFRAFAAAALTESGPSGIFLSVERRTDQESFSHRETALLASIVPHLRRAAEIASRWFIASPTLRFSACWQASSGEALLMMVLRAGRLRSSAPLHDP